ncbi:hypothetical protein Acr_15g0005070 [Actinidia rufa]|uniref:Uncharacterized protein n=1 Tax=Actinidia rufa TaxID=165716 RepID=A0A7J0FVD6_9ERIC|nr:hypothetical protein Acr_15g0005070 [Actinidia rufa]
MLGKLVLPMQAVRTHFPTVGIPAETHAKESLYFTDARTNEWIGAIAVSDSNTLSYMLTFGRTYHLKANDAIRFCRSVHPLNSRHFLIEIQERGAVRTDPSQSGSAENNGDGDDSGQGVALLLSH